MSCQKPWTNQGKHLVLPYQTQPFHVFHVLVLSVGILWNRSPDMLIEVYKLGHL